MKRERRGKRRKEIRKRENNNMGRDVRKGIGGSRKEKNTIRKTEERKITLRNDSRNRQSGKEKKREKRSRSRGRNGGKEKKIHQGDGKGGRREGVKGGGESYRHAGGEYS